MLDRLPNEIQERIFACVHHGEDVEALVRVSQVSRRFAAALHLRNARIRTEGAARRFIERIDSSNSGRVRNLVVEHRPVATKSSRSSPRRRNQTSDGVSCAFISRLCGTLPKVEVLTLRGIDLSGLRTRQLGSALSAGTLCSLVISSPVGPDAPTSDELRLSVHTLACLLRDLPELKHLGVRGMRGSPSSLRGLSPPSCRLRSLALFDLHGVSAAHLAWLLASTTKADSLKQLAFELDPRWRPYQLSALKWALLAVEHVAVTTFNPRAVAKLPQHFPSLRSYAFRTPGTVDSGDLLTSVPWGRPVRIHDASARGCAIGSTVRSLARRPVIAAVGTPSRSRRSTLFARREDQGSSPRTGLIDLKANKRPRRRTQLSVLLSCEPLDADQTLLIPAR